MSEDFSRRSILKSSLGIPLAGVAMQYATDEVAAADDDSTLPADEYAALRSRWADLLTGGSIDQTKAKYDDALATLDQDTQEYQNTIETDPTDRLWSDLPIPADASSNHSEGNLTNSYNRLMRMAQAYQTEGSAFEGDSSLVSDIVTGLDFLYNRLYNEDQSQFGNWWHWEIGAPMQLMGICTLLYSDLTSTQVTNYTNAVATHVDSPYEYTFYDHPTGGANRVDESIITALRGILTKTDSTIALARDCIQDSNIFQHQTASSGNGLYPDGSYVYHKAVPYIGTYGAILFGGLSELFTILGGSSWELTGVDRDVIYEAVGDAVSPFMYKGLMMDAVSGRSISREGQSDHTRGHAMTGTVLQMANFVPEPYATEFKELAKGWIENDTYDSFISDAEVTDIANAEAVLEDSSITAASEPVQSTVFHNMDRVVHNRSDWAFTISMCSDRIARYEALNQENMQGWYTGAGMTQLYSDDLGHYADAYWPTVDPYRLPGTTVETSERAALSGSNAPLPSTQWVGGATVDEEFSMVGMEFEAERAPLTGKKSWLALDDMIVALGSDITLVEENRVDGSPPNPDATQVTSTADTFVRDGASSADNYSTWGLMITKTSPAEGYNRDSFLQFDLGSLSGSVEQATLHLYTQVKTDDDISSTNLSVSEVTDDSWNGSELTWDTKPEIGSEIGTMTVSDTKQFHAVDVTEFVNSQVSGDGTASFALQSDPRCEIDSPDAGGQNAPQLSIAMSGDGVSSTIDSGETSGSDGPTVETTVENRNLHTDADEVLTVDDTAKSTDPDWSETLSSVSWAHLDGTGGYLFPNEPTIEAKRENRSGSWSDINSAGSTDDITREYQTLWFDHGAGASGATYAYAVLPGLTAAETKQRSQNSDYEIIANNETVQAVTVPRLGLTAVNFWSSGSITVPDTDRTLSSQGPASVILRHRNSELAISVADPSRTQETVTVEYDYTTTGTVSKDPAVGVSQYQPTVVMDVAVGGSRGKTHSATFDLPTTLMATAGTFVRDGDKSGNSYGWGIMVVKDDAVGYNRESFAQFDISSLSGSVEQATLQLFGETDASSADVSISEVTDDDWDGNVTWDTKPEIGSEIGTMTVSGPRQFHEIDVTEFVNSQASGDETVSFAIQPTDDARTEFDSASGGTNPPQMRVVTSGDSATSMPTIESTTHMRSVDLSWDEPSGTVAEYNVYLDGASQPTQTVSGSSATVSDLDPATTYDVSVTAMNNDEESTVATTTVTTDAMSIFEAIDTNGDDEVDDTELLQASDHWRSGAEVEGTGGETVDDLDLLELAERWRNSGT